MSGVMEMSDAPMVLVTVEGGIADVTVIRGSVDVLQWDWDDIDDGDEDVLESAIEQAEGLPEDYAPREEILKEMRRRLDDRRDAEAADKRAEAEAREWRLENARKVLREAGEL